MIVDAILYLMQTLLVLILCLIITIVFCGIFFVVDLYKRMKEELYYENLKENNESNRRF